MTEDNKQPATGEQTPEKLKMATVALSDLITIEVSGQFLQRLHSLLVSMCDEVGQKEVIKIYERLSKNEPPQSTHEESICILTALIDAVESGAREQGKIQEKEVTPEEALQMLEFLSIKDEPTVPPTGN